jgi:hypothetical protein
MTKMREGGKTWAGERKRLYITVAEVFGSWKKVIIITEFFIFLGADFIRTDDTTGVDIRQRRIRRQVRT